jgi:HEAT repeat protein
MTEEFEQSLAEISFEEVLRALADESEPFPARLLYRLSGLDGEELTQMAATWALASEQRRLGLLEDMEMLAEANTVLQFDAIARLALDDEEEAVRVVAIRSLWLSEQTDLAKRFHEMLENDPSPAGRAQAAAGLGRFVYLGELGKIPDDLSNQIVDRLLALMDEGVEELIRRRALESLGYSEREAVAERIQDAYEYGDEEWQASALFAMGRSADDRWGPLVLERLDDQNPDLAKEAAKAAGELELNEAIPTLMELLHDEDAEVRFTAAWSLSQIGGSEASAALEDLLERSDDEDEMDLIENALENLSLTNEINDLTLLDLSEEDLEAAIKSPDEDEDEDLGL